ETAFVVVEAAAGGTLAELIAKPGQTIAAGGVLGRIAAASAVPPAAAKSAAKQSTTATTEKTVSHDQASGGGKVVPVLMPQAGNTMEEGTVVAWRVQEGDRIAVGQIICEIETDKATMEFEAPDAGRIARIVAVIGQPIAVKEPIALLAESDADADAFLAGG